MFSNKYHYHNLILDGKKVDINNFDFSTVNLPKIDFDLVAEVIVFNYQYLIDNFDDAEFNERYCDLTVLSPRKNSKYARGYYAWDAIPDSQPIEEAIYDALFEIYDDFNLRNYFDFILYNVASYNDYAVKYFYDNIIDKIQNATVKKFEEKISEKLQNK